VEEEEEGLLIDSLSLLKFSCVKPIFLNVDRRSFNDNDDDDDDDTSDEEEDEGEAAAPVFANTS